MSVNSASLQEDGHWRSWGTQKSITRDSACTCLSPVVRAVIDSANAPIVAVSRRGCVCPKGQFWTGYLRAVWLEIFGPVFPGVSAEIDPRGLPI